MGAYSLAPVVTPEIHAKVMREVIHPTLKGMQQEGIPYSGFLYAGLMIGRRWANSRCLSSIAEWCTPKPNPS
jgi:phosphoribosylamine-glycine ligase